MIELTELHGSSVFINIDKIIKFYRVESNLSFTKTAHTYIQLDGCDAKVIETCEDICEICKNKKKLTININNNENK